MSFFKHFGKSKLKKATNKTKELIAKADKGGYTDGVIGEMTEKLSEDHLALSEARRRVKKEKKDYVDAKALFDKRVIAASKLSDLVDDGDTSKQGSLDNLLSLLEKSESKVDKEKQEFDFWEGHLDVLEKKYEKASGELSSAKSKIEQSFATLEQANIKKEQADISRNESERGSGLTSSMSSLNTALNVLNEATDKAEAEAEASMSLAEVMRSDPIEKDPNIEAIMNEIDGVGETISSKDRLAKLLNK